MKALYLRDERLNQDLAFTRCVVDKVKGLIREIGENKIPRAKIVETTVECHREAYGKPIGQREEPKYYGDLDRVRVLLGQPKEVKQGFTPEFRVQRPEWYKLNPDFFNWNEEATKIAESYARLNMFAREILKRVLREKGTVSITVNEFHEIALAALRELCKRGDVNDAVKKYSSALITRLEGREGQDKLFKGFVLPISRLSSNTLIIYEPGRITLTRELQRLLMPEARPASMPIATPVNLLDALLEAYTSIISERLGVQPPRDIGIPVSLSAFEEKLAEKLGIDRGSAREYIQRAHALCPDGIMVEDFDVLRVSREPQVYIVPGKVEACKSEMSSAG